VLLSDPVLFYRWGVAVVLGCACASFVLLMLIDAPYGRFMREGWGPAVRARFGWIAMELPSPVCFAIAYMTGDNRGELVPLLLMGAYQAHYIHRTFIFPLLVRGPAKENSIVTVAVAIVFNAGNGLLCGLAVSHMGSYGDEWLTDPRFIFGAALFLAGAAINLHSDHLLRTLRKPGESGYRIPHGGLFRWVSSPNYLGEIIEWCGWALASWSTAGLAFALFTASNLVPRARSNQRWYHEKFPDYPPRRRTLIPGLW